MNIAKLSRPRGRFANPVAAAYTGLLITMVVWSLVPVFLKKLLSVLTPTELSFSRFLLSGALLLAWVTVARFGELVRMFRQDFKLVILCTVFGPLLAMVCFNFAILHITIGTAAVFAAFEPLFTYMLAVLLGQEAWKGKRMAAIVVALAGMALVILSGNAWGPVYFKSLLLVTLTPLIWAANNIITKEIVRRHAPIVMVAASFVLSALMLIPTLTPHYAAALLHMGPGLWLALIYCIISTIFGFTIWYWSMQHLPPSSVAMSMYVIPVLSVAAGMIFLHEPMSWLKASGIAAVLLGLYLVTFRFR